MSKANLSFAVFACCLCSSLAARAESAPSGQINISNVSVGEGDSGMTPFTAQVTTYGVPSLVVVNISATPGTADESDYVFTTTQLTLTGSSASPQTVSGYIIGDTDPEGDQYFTLTATLATPGSYPFMYSTGGKVTITDDDQARASQLHVEGVSLLEGDQGTTTAEVRVLLEPASTNKVTVAYQTVDGTAIAGQDYQSASGTLTFAPGEVLKILPIVIVGDTLPESDESFAVQLSQPKMALLGSARADVVIANDDSVVHATIADLTVDEGNDGVKSVPITITFDRPVSGTGKVQVRLVGATAVADQDFRGLSQTLDPTAGATTMTFNVEILSDTEPECDEGLRIQYNEVYMGDDTIKTARLVLRNDDGPAPGCSDPFTPQLPAEPARDGGTSLPIPVDTGTSLPPPLDCFPAPVDTGASLPPPADSGEAGSISDAQVGWGGVTDTQAASGIGLGDIPDSATFAPQGQHLGTSGCSCSLTTPARHTSLLVFAAAGLLAALMRRSRSK